jgi:hypothetical protein
MKTLKIAVVFSIVTASASALAVACDDSSNAVKEPNPGADASVTPPTTDAGKLPDGAVVPPPDGGPTDCVQNPKTHLEIINACTDAVKITKAPTLPLLLSDGGLLPLP